MRKKRGTSLSKPEIRHVDMPQRGEELGDIPDQSFAFGVLGSKLSAAKRGNERI